MNNLGRTLLTGGSIIGAFLFGAVMQKYRDTINTPESVINKLNAAKESANTAKAELAEQTRKNQDAYAALVSTKKQYQDEIRPKIEAKVRKELNDYILKADEKYEKAKKENELASLKMQLCNRDRESNYYDMKIAEAIAMSTK